MGIYSCDNSATRVMFTMLLRQNYCGLPVEVADKVFVGHATALLVGQRCNITDKQIHSAAACRCWVSRAASLWRKRAARENTSMGRGHPLAKPASATHRSK